MITKKEDNNTGVSDGIKKFLVDNLIKNIKRCLTKYLIKIIKKYFIKKLKIDTLSCLNKQLIKKILYQKSSSRI